VVFGGKESVVLGQGGKKQATGTGEMSVAIREYEGKKASGEEIKTAGRKYRTGEGKENIL